MKVNLNSDELWMCRNGHALGVVQRVRTSSNGAKIFYSQLLKFHDAVDMSCVHLAEAVVDCEIEGTTRVFCNVPGCVGDDGKQTARMWHMDQKLAATFLGPLYGNKEVEGE